MPKHIKPVDLSTCELLFLYSTNIKFSTIRFSFDSCWLYVEMFKCTSQWVKLSIYFKTLISELSEKS